MHPHRAGFGVCRQRPLKTQRVAGLRVGQQQQKPQPYHRLAALHQRPSPICSPACSSLTAPSASSSEPFWPIPAVLPAITPPTGVAAKPTATPPPTPRPTATSLVPGGSACRSSSWTYRSFPAGSARRRCRRSFLQPRAAPVATVAAPAATPPPMAAPFSYSHSGYGSYSNSSSSATTPFSGSDASTPRSTSPSASVASSAVASAAAGGVPPGGVPRNKRLSLSSTRRLSALNPMAAVDLAALVARMRLHTLDRHRGYVQSTSSREIQQPKMTTHIDYEAAGGYQVLREAQWNKGLSFTPEERLQKNLTGLVPHVMEDLDMQCERALKMLRARPTDVDRYLYLSTLRSENVDLFYRLLITNARELMPLVYTPTIGDVCLQYSTLYTRPEALYISIKQRKSIKTILRNWPHADPEICVVTDGSRILGLGDLGINGVGIPIGKLSLYTAAAGIRPNKTLPIVLDCGTNNEDNLADPHYLGIRAKRVPVEEQQEFMDEFMSACAEVFPNMVVQFEDFESEKAFNYLARYRDSYRCFNDDIQGTGAVVLAGYIGAVNLSGVPIEEQRLVFMGAGSAGVGVAKQLVEFYTRRGLSEKAAREKFWLVDTKGLVTKDRGDRLADHKKYFARDDNGGHQFRTLEEVIEYVKPTALVGLTATFGVFTESVVRALKASVEAGGLNRRPILFPLSNPLTKAECTFEQAVDWTDGTVIFASGSPFAPYTVQRGDQQVVYRPNQGNNVYVFPGIGLGAILAKATRVTDDMIYTSAEALANSLNAEEIHQGLIYPHIKRVRDASLAVAREVMKAARRDGVSGLPNEQWEEWEEWGDIALNKYIGQQIYDPRP